MKILNLIRALQSGFDKQSLRQLDYTESQISESEQIIKYLFVCFRNKFLGVEHA